MQTDAIAMEIRASLWGVLKKLEIDLLCDPNIPAYTQKTVYCTTEIIAHTHLLML